MSPVIFALLLSLFASFASKDFDKDFNHASAIKATYTIAGADIERNRA